jgi:uncharacterized iron-regulated membrane protein
MDVLNVPGRLFGSAINLNTPGHYVHWGFIQISVANLVVIIAMIVVLFAAILLPFPHRRARRQ